MFLKLGGMANLEAEYRSKLFFKATGVNIQAMLLFIILSVMTSLSLVTCQTDQECKLEVVNRKDFEEKIVIYLSEDSKSLLIEYNLTISSRGNITDWNNIADSTSIEPWRWFRAKGDEIIRFLLIYDRIFLGSVFFYKIYKYFPVDLVDHPDGCLQNISTTETSSFIMRALIEDFGIRFEDLRTSSKLYKEPFICTTRRDNGKTYKWCCKNDLHNEIVCNSVQE
ncbi:uncharacterized protein LOC129926001 [Biomphalaria glabrata]|uniref:Uncharacterized protein LOC129926001 n=1 Tax=Biomphalaria glabrata TaxID=6526 RepID=A0A9W3A8L5_BIOGL|nr:uncharacterized protein LOC129926001 [Biomphalaria glabrata]